MVNTIVKNDELTAAVLEMLAAKAELAVARQLDCDADARHLEAVGRMNEVYREKRHCLGLIASDDGLDADSEEAVSFLRSYVEWLDEEHDRLNEADYYSTLDACWSAGCRLEAARQRARAAESRAWQMHQAWRQAD